MKYTFGALAAAVFLYISLYAGIWIDSRIYWKKHQPYYYEHEPQSITFYSDGLKLSSHFYVSDTSTFPIVIVVHGLTEEGKDFDLYEIIANELIKNKIGAFVIDLRGFSDSEDPKEINSYDDFDLAVDVHNAVEAVLDLPGVDTSRIFLLGHSMGAGVVLDAIYRDETGKIKGVVSIEPDRRGRELDTLKFAKRLTKDLRLKYMFNPGVTDSLEKSTNTFFVLEKLKNHPPILFVESEEAERHELFLKDYELLTEPKGLKVIPDTYHYFGTKYGDNWGKKKALLRFMRKLPGFPDAIINIKAINILTDELVLFFNDPHSVNRY